MLVPRHLLERLRRLRMLGPRVQRALAMQILRRLPHRPDVRRLARRAALQLSERNLFRERGRLLRGLRLRHVAVRVGAHVR